MVPEVGSAPTSPPLQGGANLPQLLGVKMVVPAGNAPASSGYQPGALLLSYRTMAEGVGSAPTSVVTDPVFETGAASLYLPAFQKMAARVGLAPTPNGLTGRRATLTLPGNGELALPAGLAPASVRLEDERLVYFGHGSIRKWSEQQDFHQRPPGPKPGALNTELRSEKMADPKGLAPSAFPQTTGCSAN